MLRHGRADSGTGTGGAGRAGHRSGASLNHLRLRILASPALTDFLTTDWYDRLSEFARRCELAIDVKTDYEFQPTDFTLLTEALQPEPSPRPRLRRERTALLPAVLNDVARQPRRRAEK